MKEYPILLVRLRANVLQKQDTTTRPRGIWRPQSLRHDRDTSTPQPALGNTRTKHPQPIRRTERPRTIAMKGMVPTGQIDTAIACEVSRDHRRIVADEI